MDRRRISFGSQYKFPLKLFEVVNDSVLLKWNDTGEAIIAEQRNFEDHVMQWYPGFVQVKSFHNLRRLFRDYDFTHVTLRQKKPYGLKMQFRHPCFKRSEPELLFQVKKKSRRRLRPLATSSPKNPRRRMKWLENKISRGSGFRGREHNFRHDMYFDMGCEISLDSSVHLTEQSGSEYSCYERSSASLIIEDHRNGNYTITSQPDCNSHHCSTRNIIAQNDLLTREDIFIVLQIYAKNELSEAEFWELVTRWYGKECEGNTWEAIEKYIDSIVHHELSPLHHKGFYYALALNEL